MKRKLLPITILLAGVMMLASCLGDDDSTSNITTYSDCALTAFSIGTLNQTYLDCNGDTIKKTDATDSTTTVDCSSYKMTIDQAKGEVYNTDSLPVGVDISKVVCTVTSKNSGIIVLKRVDNDTLDYYTSTDSISFATKDSTREFRVYSTDGTAFRKYNVKLNVHKEFADSFRWSCQPVEALQRQAVASRTVALGKKVVAVVSDGVNSWFQANTTGVAADGFKTLSSNRNGLLGADVYKNVAVLNGWLYVLDGTQILKSQDAQNWQTCAAAPAGMKQLVGASEMKLYALTESGMSSSVDGVEWTAETLDPSISASQLPTGTVTLNVLPLATNKGFYRLVMTGNSATGSKSATIWGKIENTNDLSDNYSWTLYDGEGTKLLPDMQQINTVVYDGKLFAIGGTGLNGSSVKPYAKVYCSTDQGLTWTKATLFGLPSGFSTTDAADAASMGVDADNNLWIVSPVAHQAWKTRVNRLGWKTTK